MIGSSLCGSEVNISTSALAMLPKMLRSIVLEAQRSGQTHDMINRCIYSARKPNIYNKKYISYHMYMYIIMYTMHAHVYYVI